MQIARNGQHPWHEFEYIFTQCFAITENTDLVGSTDEIWIEYRKINAWPYGLLKWSIEMVHLRFLENNISGTKT